MTIAINGGSYSPPHAREITVKGGEAKITLVEPILRHKREMIEGAFQNYRRRYGPLSLKMRVDTRAIVIWGTSDEKLKEAIEWLELKPVAPRPAAQRQRLNPVMRDRRMLARRAAAG